MSYVRRYTAINHSKNLIIWRYQVETPSPHGCMCESGRCWCTAMDELSLFEKLVQMDLYITRRAADYFQNVPYALGEAIWTRALTASNTGMYFEPRWRFTTDVLYYRWDAIFHTLRWQDYWGYGPLPIAVDLWSPENPLYGTKDWDDRGQWYDYWNERE